MIDNSIIRKAKLGDEEAFNEILHEYENLIALKTRKYFIIGGDRDDLFQEGVIGLMKAIEAYNDEKASFKTFAMLCVKRQILTAISVDNTYKNKLLNQSMSDVYITEDEDFSYTKQKSLTYYDPEELYLGKEKIQLLEKYLETLLSPMEMGVFKKLEAGYTYIEIAELIGITKKASDNCIQRIKKKINQFLERYEAI
ncbi:sigma-70 family RNA polymerase sigma factor [Cetobacterium ceti]